jgi:hypothetical protein
MICGIGSPPAGGELTTCDTLSRTSAVAGRTALPWDVGNGSRMEARQGAIRITSETPMLVLGAPQPAIRLNPMRDPVNRPISRPQRERAGHLAYRNFERSRIRCS